jgi:hypothetical protein
MSNINSCPNCQTSWLSDPIPEVLAKQKIKTGYYNTIEDAIEDAKKAAASYGWTPENNKCFKLEIGISNVIEDRIVAYVCPKCEFQIDKN